MSRTTFGVTLALIAAMVGGVIWFYARPRPNLKDIAARPLPELPPIAVAAGDWPWWRGPTMDNHSPDVKAPTSWSETKNILWKTAISGRGSSTPILVGNRVVVTSADEQAERQFVVCLDRTGGGKLWETTIHEKNLPPKHDQNTHASSTPASDGQRIFVAFANNNAVHVTALDFDGNILWRKEAGPHGGAGSHGYASSLALWGPFVFVSDDTTAGGWIAALNRETGEFSWRKGRQVGMGSYGSPVVVEFAGRPQIILAGNDTVASYEPQFGNIIWQGWGLSDVTGNTVTVTPTMIFASSGTPRKLLALNADISKAWAKENKNEIPYPPSMLWNDGGLYCVSDHGSAVCYKDRTGEQKWTERLRGEYYSSPLLVGNLIYACNRDGLTTIFEASPHGYSELARNKLDAGIDASPIAIGGKLYIRTLTHLYCIGEK
jgi:outer membrane protein assembly factor BamB